MKFYSRGMILLSIGIILLITVISIVAYREGTKYLYPIKYKEDVCKFSKQYGVDPYLIFSIIKAESSFNPKAISNKKAMGLMQLTESTARWGAKSLKLKNFEIDDLYIPGINIQIGTWYVSKLMKQFSNDTELVLAAYNGGSGNVYQWLDDRNFSEDGGTLTKIPFKETEEFVKRVKNNYKKYKRCYNL